MTYYEFNYNLLLGKFMAPWSHTLIIIYMTTFSEVEKIKIYIGDDLADDLSVLIKKENLSGKRILLVTGINSLDKSSWKTEFYKTLEKNNLEIVRHVKVAPNPDLLYSQTVISEEDIFDLILCVGGGSVVDFAKLLKLKYYNKADILSFYTLVGSGSIVTPFTVYDNHEFKVGEHSEEIIPDFVYVNTNIIDNLSVEQKLAGICDICAHSIESYLSNKSSIFSRSLANKSLGILQNNISFLENIKAIDLVKADIYAALSESEAAVLFPHAAGHYLTYKFGISHNIASVYCLHEYLELLDTKGVEVGYFLSFFKEVMSVLNKYGLLAKDALRDDQIEELFILVGRYMDFVFDNSPACIEKKEYIDILRSKRNFSESVLFNNLNKTIERAKKSEMYADKLKEFPDKLRSLHDLKTLPFTSKADLRQAYPFKGLSGDMKQVVEMHTSSGTTGKPTLSFYNRNDIITGSKAIAEAWANFGINCDSRIQFIMSYGLFSGAMLNTYALEELGAFVLPSGIQPIEKQVNLMIDFEIDTIVATPSYLLYLADYLNEHEEYKSKLKLLRAIAAGEVYSDAVRRKIERKLNIVVYDHYGLCEVNTGIAYECPEKNGLHILDDYVIPEIINPSTGENLPDGEYGELVLTSLKKEASPIIRYRTGDITCFKKGVCKCGNPRVRIDRIKSRIDDLLFIRGLKVNPHELKECIIDIVGDNLYCGYMKITVKKNSIDFTPQIMLCVKDKNSVSLDELKKKVKDKTQVGFNFNMIDSKEVNLFENTKLKLVEYVD